MYIFIKNNILRIKQWFKGACVVPNIVVGPKEQQIIMFHIKLNKIIDLSRFFWQHFHIPPLNQTYQHLVILDYYTFIKLCHYFYLFIYFFICSHQHLISKRRSLPFYSKQLIKKYKVKTIGKKIT